MQVEEPWWRFVADRISAWKLEVALDWRTPTTWLDRIDEVWLGATPDILPPAEWPHSHWLAFEHGEAVPSTDRTAEPLLREYRGVVESPDSVALRIARVRELLASAVHAEARRRLPETTAEAWAISTLTDALRIGPAMGQRLLEAGFYDPNAVHSATDAQLLSVPGIGPKRLSEIRTKLDYPRRPAEAPASRFGLPEALARAACLEYVRRAFRLDEWERDGIERVRWVTQADECVCPRCRPLDGQTFSIAEARTIVAGEFCALPEWEDEAQGYSAEESAAQVGPRTYFEHLPVGCRCSLAAVFE